MNTTKSDSLGDRFFFGDAHISVESDPCPWTIKFCSVDHPQFFGGEPSHPYKYKQIGISSFSIYEAMDDAFEYAAQLGEFQHSILEDWKKLQNQKDKEGSVGEFFDRMQRKTKQIKQSIKKDTSKSFVDTDLLIYAVLKWD